MDAVTQKKVAVKGIEPPPVGMQVVKTTLRPTFHYCKKDYLEVYIVDFHSYDSCENQFRFHYNCHCEYID